MAGTLTLFSGKASAGGGEPPTTQPVDWTRADILWSNAAITWETTEY